MISRFLVFLPLFLFALPLQAQPAKTQEAPASQTTVAITQSAQIARELVEKLSRGGDSQEARTMREIEAVRWQISAALVDRLETLKLLPEAEKRRIRGPFHITLVLLSNLRVDEAERQLLEIADFQLDAATAPLGHWNNNSPASYPAAYALSRMGSKELISSLFTKISQTTNDTKRRAYTWILVQILGRNIALPALKNELAAEQQRLAAENRRSDALINLEKTVALLESRETILIAPPMAKP